ncbi:hypothetical protein KUG02_06430 [Streptococcus equi subsp. zooepidemicus]|uniref:hypothetical protein n=1 Tax=Streptococcus equi TaxID=1336 RepID=UPI0013F686E1|nr:hypothetical protein [Streptococcus equi]MCD3433337.1 hypothetical protein [Streptococcus equi subsp. zooepidemicus]MDI5953995.1 hypothetical protein [Streptococcus equi subsp. zooepidemicus]QTZ59315.1 hypothetical protein MCPGFBBE_01420 [Streptococcus equi subsp. zooepidemicus]QUF61995.1 hypothetical protein KCL43_07330 [Streptococcus equi subsp. zooepidemicus]QWN60692.1 hypothetical protein GJ622_07080 [Streptococcus equi subsp. zooepidemicus]
MRLFKKQTHNQGSFKRLIHRLSGMSEADLHKVNQLLDVVFDSTSQMISDVKKAPKVISKEPTLDETITEAKNKLNTEQLEKRIEQFRQAKKPKSG